MSSTAELKKVKLNITNIKSVLLDGKKAVDEKNKEREDFLTKLSEERKQKREEKSLEKPIKPTEKKPDLKSPVKSSAGLMDRIFTFVGAIVGGIVVKALPDIIDAIKKVIEKVKPFFEKVVEFLQPVFTSIGKLFESEESYESEKEKVNSDIETVQVAGKDIDDQVGELDKASDEVINENKGLNENAKALGVEESDLMKDRVTKDDDKDDKEVKNNDDSNNVESNEVLTVENLGPTPEDHGKSAEELSMQPRRVQDPDNIRRLAKEFPELNIPSNGAASAAGSVLEENKTTFKGKSQFTW